jgi:anti-anti-sigma factor
MAWLHIDDFLDVDVETGEDGAPLVVAMVGELDAAACPPAQALVEALIDGTAPVVIDLSGARFFSAAGITMLLALQDRATAKGTSLTLRDPHPAVARLLDLAGVAPRLTSARRPARGATEAV